jgi:hypothetical protein
MMKKKSLKPLRQVNLFSGVPDRVRTVKAKKKTETLKVVKAKYEKSVQTKNLVRNFFENQLMLPVISSADSNFGRERILPLVPDEYLEKGFPDLVTRHVAFRVSDGLDNRLLHQQAKRAVTRQTWNDQQIISTHSELLYESLSVLTYDGVPEEKIDVLEWIFADDIVIWHGRKVKVENVPFSFKACCRFCGYDYSILQSFVYSKLPSEYKQYIQLDAAA